MISDIRTTVTINVTTSGAIGFTISNDNFFEALGAVESVRAIMRMRVLDGCRGTNKIAEVEIVEEKPVANTI